MTAPGAWRRSSFCAAGDCVELRFWNGRVWLRRLKAGRTSTAAAMSVTPAEFAAFVQGVKAGEFDDLTGGQS